MPKKHNLRLGYVVRAAGAPQVWVYQREGAATPSRPDRISLRRSWV